MACNTSHCLVGPTGNPSSGESWYFILPFTPCGATAQIFSNLLTLRLSRHTMTVEIVFPVARPGRARCWMRHVLTWPRWSHVIWLQGTRFWCNYTSVGLLIPWKIFTQVSHNHSGTAVDGELHTARHTPAVDCIIFLQRCSSDTSVCHLWLISFWSLDKGKLRSSASWKVSVSSI